MFHWWVVPAVREDVCFQPPAEATVKLVCVDIFYCPQGRSDFGIVLDPVGAVCTLPGLSHHFGWDPAKDVLKDLDPQKNMG